MTLPSSITIDLDLEALEEILAQFKATAQQSRGCHGLIDFIFCNCRNMFYDNIYC